MRITQRLKDCAAKAKKAGYEHVYCVVGAYRATTYCRFHKIETILALPLGYSTTGRPQNEKYMWTGFPNTRMADCEKDIQYNRLFALFCAD